MPASADKLGWSLWSKNCWLHPHLRKTLKERTCSGQTSSVSQPWLEPSGLLDEGVWDYQTLKKIRMVTHTPSNAERVCVWQVLNLKRSRRSRGLEEKEARVRSDGVMGGLGLHLSSFLACKVNFAGARQVYPASSGSGVTQHRWGTTGLHVKWLLVQPGWPVFHPSCLLNSKTIFLYVGGLFPDLDFMPQVEVFIMCDLIGALQLGKPLLVSCGLISCWYSGY